jgi:hypothetical protein
MFLVRDVLVRCKRRAGRGWDYLVGCQRYFGVATIARISQQRLGDKSLDADFSLVNYLMLGIDWSIQEFQALSLTRPSPE